MKGRHEEGVRLYCDVLDDDPFCAAAFLDRGKYFIRGQDWERALGDFGHAAALGKADHNVCNDIGVCHFELGQAEQVRGALGRSRRPLARC